MRKTKDSTRRKAVRYAAIDDQIKALQAEQRKLREDLLVELDADQTVGPVTRVDAERVGLTEELEAYLKDQRVYSRVTRPTLVAKALWAEADRLGVETEIRNRAEVTTVSSLRVKR